MTTNPPTTHAPESARDLLWRHGLPEDVIDGALALFAQELAGKIRTTDLPDWFTDVDLFENGTGWAADLIDPTHPEQPAAVAVPPPAPRADDQAALRDRIAERPERYAVAIHDAMESDLSLVDQEPGQQALFARAAEAVMALADSEQATLRRKLAAAEKIRENADFHLGQEMARRQLAEKEAARLSADQAAVLNAAAQHLYTALFPAVYDDMGQKAAEGVQRAVSELRRLAVEAQQQPETDGAQR